ncbi:MAG TPA: NADPH-dependent FMN reductase [Kofleriaceae bacterium]|nr:NADPH-dependent FMN reductase [Kofleriaceae bacterium]
MTTVIGISGSLRAGSLNSALLRAAGELAPSGLTVEIASIQGIPLYDGDVEEKEGIPPAVAALKDRIAGADGLLLASPEYNNGVPGVLKNAIDWMSRPASDIKRVFGDRPVGVIGASGGPGGTRLSQVAWLPTLRLLGMSFFSGKSVFVATGSQVIQDGRLTDEKTRQVVKGYMAGFAAFVDRLKGGSR